jgi:flagellar FliJ protein
MTFRFRGARVLDWRRAQADEARVAFVRATESEREAAAAVARADQEHDHAEHDLRTVLARPVDVGTLHRYRNWIHRRREHAAECRRLHAERREAAERAAGVLQTAMRHVKVMERLRDRAWRRYLEDERRREMKEIDQLATLRFARRRARQGADREY